jgi:hypothetical protein
LPIDSSTLTINGQSEQLTAPVAPTLDATAAEPAPSASAAAAAAAAATAGTRDRFGNLVVEGDVRGMMAFGGSTLQGIWEGTFNGVPQTVKMLTAYAQTHGYKFDSTVNPPYDIVVAAEVRDSTGAITSYARHQVSLPLLDAPAQTPEQEAGLLPPEQNGAPAAAGSAPAPAASSAPAAAATAAE